MPRAFTRFAFSPAVKAAQARYSAREHGALLEQKDPPRDRLNDDLIAFIEDMDSFFIGTASHDGWPHVQHRGGPPGFLKVLDDRTLAFADYAGNRHYITVGNLSENDRVMLFLIDYERGRRMKIWGRAQVIDDATGLVDRVRDPAEQSDGLVPSLLCPSWVDCIIATRGYDFRKGQLSIGASSNAVSGLRPLEAPVWLRRGFH